MNSAASIAIILSSSVIIVGTILLVKMKLRRYREAKRAIATFHEFNRKVQAELQELEEQGRLCYRSLDGEAMRLLYEARQMVSHGCKLEQLGMEALATGNGQLLADVGKLYDLQNGERPCPQALQIEELSPRAYKLYAALLLKRVEEKIRVGTENRNRIYLAA